MNVKETTKEERKAKRERKIKEKCERRGLEYIPKSNGKAKARKDGGRSHREDEEVKKRMAEEIMNKRALQRVKSANESKSARFVGAVNELLQNISKSLEDTNDGDSDGEGDGDTAANVLDASESEKKRAKKKRKLTEDADYLQPRPCDYNGQGTARPSIFLDFDAPDFAPRFEKQFAEHVDGFFGKVKTKSMKKQKKKEEADSTESAAYLMKSKFVKGNMSADEKVEELIRRGLL